MPVIYMPHGLSFPISLRDSNHERIARPSCHGTFIGRRKALSYLIHHFDGIAEFKFILRASLGGGDGVAGVVLGHRTSINHPALFEAASTLHGKSFSASRRSSFRAEIHRASALTRVMRAPHAHRDHSGFGGFRLRRFRSRFSRVGSSADALPPGPKDLRFFVRNERGWLTVPL